MHAVSSESYTLEVEGLYIDCKHLSIFRDHFFKSKANNLDTKATFIIYC